MNSARTGTTSRPARLEGDVHDEPVAGIRARCVHDREVDEGVRVEPRAVPRVEAVGDDVLGLAGAGHGGDGVEDGPVTGRGGTRGCSQRSLAARRRPGAPRPAPRRRGPGTASSPRTVRRPGPVRASGTRARRTGTALSRSGAPRWGHAPGPAASRPSRSRQATTSLPATSRPKGRSGPYVTARGQHVPVARGPGLGPSASAAAMTAGRASRQVGSCRSHVTGAAQRQHAAPRLAESVPGVAFMSEPSAGDRVRVGASAARGAARGGHGAAPIPAMPRRATAARPGAGDRPHAGG